MKSIISSSFSTTAQRLDSLAVLLLITQFALVIGYYTYLPESVPVHFSINGQPDRFGSRQELFAGPFVAAFIFVIFRWIRMIPAEFYNWSEKLTPEDKAKQIRNSHELMAMLGLATIMFITWTLWNGLQVALNGGSKESWVSVFLFLLSLCGATIFYLWRYYRRS